MLDKSNHNSGCDFAEQIVSYLYDEISDSEKSNFETHLTHCRSCESELSGFTSVRSSIREWCLEDFASLSVPVFERPLKEKSREVSRSPFETILAYFTVSPKWVSAGAAFAVIALFAGLFWFSAISTTDRKIAEYREETAEEPVPSPKNDALRNDLTAMNANNENANNEKEATEALPQVKTPKVVTNEPEKIVSTRVKNMAHSTVNNSQNTKIKKSTVAKADKNNKTVPQRLNKNNAPTLLVEDEEDDSLRLSDIFEEVSLK